MSYNLIIWAILEYGDSKGNCSQCGITVCKGNARSGISLAKLKSFERHLQDNQHFAQYGGIHGIPFLGIFPQVQAQAGIASADPQQQQQIQPIDRHRTRTQPGELKEPKRVKLVDTGILN